MKQPLGEFDLIQRFFQRPAHRSPLGVGGELRPAGPAPRHAAGRLQRHAGARPPLFARRGPRLLGHRALAVDLSDLAACGAPTPGLYPWPWPCRTATRPGAKPSAKGCSPWPKPTTANSSAATPRKARSPSHHRVWGSAQRPSHFAQRCPGGRRYLGQRHPGRCPLGAGRAAAPARAAAPVFAQARQRLEAPTPRVALGQALRRHCQQRPGRERSGCWAT